jgi:hypothetical protein
MTPDQQARAIQSLAKTVQNSKVGRYTNRKGRNGLSITTITIRAEWMADEAERRGLARPEQQDNYNGTTTLYWSD